MMSDKGKPAQCVGGGKLKPFVARRPDWRIMVEEANRACLEASTAVVEAFPLNSIWLCGGVKVRISGYATLEPGYLEVTMVDAPRWFAKVYAAELEPVK